ncbi:MAG: DUF1559 domain-containing protein [Gemmataceae bacterium]
MAAPLSWKRLCLAFSLLAALASGGVLAQKPDLNPEPESPEKDGEKATPAVDLTKGATDPKVAQQDRVYQTRSQNNLKQIGLAFHNYAASHGHFADNAVSKGKPTLSWRVALLPYLDQDKLYREFRLDEPWDSKHNIKLLDKMPDVFRSPRVKLKGKGNTVYQVFRGPNAPFGRGVPPRFPGAFPDGTSNTILAVEATDAVPWTKPADVPFDRTKPVPDFGKAFGKRPLAVLADGSTRVLDLNRMSEATLKNGIDPADGMVLGADWR